MNITNFDNFEKVYESLETGVNIPDELNEGLLTGIMNFFSKVFGGRVTELDKILTKYNKNEGSYWSRWAEANHEYNKASALRDSADNNIDKQKYMEMMERSSKLIKQTTKTRDEVNDALDRQAMMIIRDNRRLRMYWEVKKAKAEEQVANNSYTSLKKQVDTDTLDSLYDNVKKAQKKAQEKIKQMPKGTMTIDFGKYEDRSKEVKPVSMDKFGIHDVEDFIYSTDSIWSERIKLMPQANKKELALKLQNAIDILNAETEKEVKNLKKELDIVKDDEKDKITSDIKKIQTYAEQDSETLTNRLGQVKNVEPEESEPLKKSEILDILIKYQDKIQKKAGDVGTAEIKRIMNDMTSLYNQMPDVDRDEEKEVDIRVTQLIDYVADIYKFRQENKITGPVAGTNLDKLNKEFKTEFPK